MTSAAAERATRAALARAQVYGLLARAFGRPDAELRSEVESGGFRKALSEALSALGCDDIAAGLDDLVPDGDLTGDFTRLFNPSVDANCPPYETEYTGAHVFMRVQQLADVAGFYRAFGLRVAAGFHERPDHIAAELEFMHVVSLKEARALASGERAHAAVCRRAQARFLEEHLGRWLTPYRQQVSALGGGFYARLAALAAEFVAWDAQRLRVAPVIAPPLRKALAPEPQLSCPTPGGETHAAR